jgi:MinD superfamily P-loop ATPase
MGSERVSERSKRPARAPVWAIASGKGGTGKTTVAVNLAKVARERVTLVDCDVEEPDAHLFLSGPVDSVHEVTARVPHVNEDRCDYCGRCARFCQFHALAVVSRVVMVFPELCHGCRGCSMVCPRQAITMVPQRVGAVERRTFGEGRTLITGTLDVGSPRANPVIEAARAQADPAVPTILDAPPGTSCPVETTLRGADLVVLVTEPTPFGLHDLTLAVALLNLMSLPFGVVVNRARPGLDQVSRYCRDEGIPVWLELPEDRRYAEAGARGEVLSDVFPEVREAFSDLARRLQEVSR